MAAIFVSFEECIFGFATRYKKKNGPLKFSVITESKIEVSVTDCGIYLTWDRLNNATYFGVSVSSLITCCVCLCVWSSNASLLSFSVERPSPAEADFPIREIQTPVDTPNAPHWDSTPHQTGLQDANKCAGQPPQNTCPLFFFFKKNE